jgi:hypothetical protein
VAHELIQGQLLRRGLLHPLALVALNPRLGPGEVELRPLRRPPLPPAGQRQRVRERGDLSLLALGDRGAAFAHTLGRAAVLGLGSVCLGQPPQLRSLQGVLLVVAAGASPRPRDRRRRLQTGALRSS